MRAFPAIALLALAACSCSKWRHRNDAALDAAFDATNDANDTCVLTVPSLATRDLVAGTTFPGALALASIPGTNDLAIAGQKGTITIVRGGAVLPSAFLDLSSRPMFDGGPSNPGEQGLLGLAFHPGYATNGRFFVAYTLGDDGTTTPNERRNIVAEFRRDPSNPDVASDVEVARLVEVVDPAPNHNGGALAFGSDGFLYAAFGDGGGGNDAGHGTCGNGLDTSTLLGKLLRLDVDASASGYAAAGNPFSGASGLPQIAHYGLRNPWRFSFDRATHDLYVADVGQVTWEELDFVPSGHALGMNFGWARYEGAHVTNFVPNTSCDALAANATAPLAEFSHATPNVLGQPHAIVGGYVYRGSAIPALTGLYLFGDAITNQVAVLTQCGDGSVRMANVEALSARDSGLASFGEDANGELTMLFVGSGRVLSIVAGP